MKKKFMLMTQTQRRRFKIRNICMHIYPINYIRLPHHGIRTTHTLLEIGQIILHILKFERQRPRLGTLYGCEGGGGITIQPGLLQNSTLTFGNPVNPDFINSDLDTFRSRSQID